MRKSKNSTEIKIPWWVSVFVTIIVSMFPAPGFSQDGSEGAVTADNSIYSEELRVFTDRDIYVAGEEVYLKVYKLNRSDCTPANMSRVVYIDLLDRYNNRISQIRAGINNQSGSVVLFLPDTIPTDNYIIRSHTRWMRNFPVELYSYKRISVINPFNRIDRMIMPVEGELPDSAAFYPESGKIVASVENRIGIRTYNSKGFPAATRGIIVTSDNDTLCEISTDNNGAGLFSIVPPGTEPVFFVAAGRKDTVRFSLPEIEASGLVISPEGTGDNDFFKLIVRKNGELPDFGRGYHLIYSPLSGKPFEKEIDPENTDEISLVKSKLPAGLARILIVDGNNRFQALRWVYNDKTGSISYKVGINDTVFQARGKVKLDITAKSQDGRPVESDIMVSVVKSFSIDRSNPGNSPGYMQMPLLETMTLRSDAPDINDCLIFYSTSDGDITGDEPHDIEDCKFIPELGGLLVGGTITDKSSGECIKNEYMVMSFVGKKAVCRFTKTDENGHFNFITNEKGNREIVIRPLSPETDDYYIELDYPFLQVPCDYKPPLFFPDTCMLPEINRAVISMQVQAIYAPFLHNETKSEVTKTTPDFYGGPVETVLISDFIGLNSIKEIVKEIVPGLTIYKKEDRSNFRITTEPLSPDFNGPPMVLVDGVPVDDIDKILTINPRDLEKIDILHRRYFISDIMINGVVHFVTAKGNLSSFETERPLFRQEFDALQPDFTFVSPEYFNDSLKTNRIPDFRNTLYWNPDLQTDENGSLPVEFFTSDETGEYTVIVEGIGPDGSTGRTEKTFYVRK